MVQEIRDHDEKPLLLHSKVDGPVADLDFLEASLLFAELAMIAYNDLEEARRAATAVGFPDVTFYDYDGAQAFRFRNGHDCIMTFRGTEPNEWNDIEADVKATSVLAETVGKVHGGFKDEVDHLWPELELALAENTLPLWFSGHSLGAAMATICASRCQRASISSSPAALYTFGSPRVGDHEYRKHVKLQHYRWVNNNDIVTRVPPVWMGFHHHGQRIYLDRRGRVRNLTGAALRRDRMRGFIEELRLWKVDHFSDHSIHAYIAAIVGVVEASR